MRLKIAIGILMATTLTCKKEPEPYYKFGTERVFETHREIPVEWENDNAVLSGTLYLPSDTNIYATLVWVHGSGKSERIRYYKPEELVRISLAKGYTDRGYAIFSYDKRGVGQSGGTYNPWTEYSNYLQLGRDDLSALKIVKKHPYVNSDFVGFIGGSQAGYTIPIVAKSTDEIAFIILINGPTGPNEEEYFF